MKTYKVKRIWTTVVTKYLLTKWSKDKKRKDAMMFEEGHIKCVQELRSVRLWNWPSWARWKFHGMLCGDPVVMVMMMMIVSKSLISIFLLKLTGSTPMSSIYKTTSLRLDHLWWTHEYTYTLARHRLNFIWC